MRIWLIPTDNTHHAAIGYKHSIDDKKQSKYIYKTCIRRISNGVEGVKMNFKLKFFSKDRTLLFLVIDLYLYLPHPLLFDPAK